MIASEQEHGYRTESEAVSRGLEGERAGRGALFVGVGALSGVDGRLGKTVLLAGFMRIREIHR